MSIYAVDFDGTIAKTRFPKIIEANKKMIALIKVLQAAGEKVILWTSREGQHLDEAVAFCKSHGIIFDAVNASLPEQLEKWNNDTRKVYADYYIDDKAMTLEMAEERLEQVMKVYSEIAEEKGSRI